MYFDNLRDHIDHKVVVIGTEILYWELQVEENGRLVRYTTPMGDDSGSVIHCDTCQKEIVNSQQYYDENYDGIIEVMIGVL